MNIALCIGSINTSDSDSYFRLTWSGPVAYLQKHGCPMIGIPASFEMR